MAALDDEPVLPPGPPRIAIVIDATISAGEYLPSRELTLDKARSNLRPMFEAASGLQVLIRAFAASCSVIWDGLPIRSRRRRRSPTLSTSQASPSTAGRSNTSCRRRTSSRSMQLSSSPMRSSCGAQETRKGMTGNDLCKDAMRLRRLGCRVAVAYKSTIPGGCPFDRAGPHAEQRIGQLAADNEGCVLNVTALDFVDRLRKVATEAVLRAKGDPAKAQALLPDLRAVPFDLAAVGEEVLIGQEPVQPVTDAAPPRFASSFVVHIMQEVAI